MTRLADLETVRGTLIDRMADCASDQNYTVMGRLLVDVLKQIAELGGAEIEGTGTALDELASRRRTTGRPDASGVAGSKASGK